VGFPGGTIDVPGPPRPELAAAVADALLDPYGHGERLVTVLLGAPAARGHVATNAWVFDATAGAVLLVRHRTLGWVCPGGHLDEGEAPAAGAARELSEETGLTLTPCVARPILVRANVFPARGDDPAHWHWNVHYAFVGDPVATLVPEADAPVDWFPLDALPTPAVADLVDIIALVAPFAGS
jgi:8-oxo-dGTP pyrophosphatase MutT (NUDIX family)